MILHRSLTISIRQQFRSQHLFGHLNLCHTILSRIICRGDTVIDATCGNGHDSLFLAQCALTNTSGRLYGFDIQEESLRNTTSRLQSVLDPDHMNRVELELRSHESFPSHIRSGSVSAITYNLGYLPGGDKAITTQVSTTLSSLKVSLDLVSRHGMISLMCYRGHWEGKLEEKEIAQYLLTLNPTKWRIMSHNIVTEKDITPILYTIFRLF